MRNWRPLLLLPADVRKALIAREQQKRFKLQPKKGDPWGLVLPFFRTVDCRRLLELLGNDDNAMLGLDGHRSSSERDWPPEADAEVLMMLRRARANMDASLLPYAEPVGPLHERWPQIKARAESGQSRPATGENFEAFDRLFDASKNSAASALRAGVLPAE